MLSFWKLHILRFLKINTMTDFKVEWDNFMWFMAVFILVVYMALCVL